jgi:hypothetical protein
MSLLRAYRQSPELDQEMQSFFNFRLEKPYYCTTMESICLREFCIMLGGLVWYA